MLDIQHTTSSRSALLAAELRDALGRRQKELPARWLAMSEAISASAAGSTGSPAADAETQLGRAALDGCLQDLSARGVVCVHPSIAPATASVLNALAARATPAAIVVVEWSSATARRMARFLAATAHDRAPLVTAIDADCTLALPLPESFPLPRLYLCLGNVVGALPAVGAVRMLRVLRTTMAPGDAMLLAVSIAAPETARALSAAANPAPHLGALASINAVFGATLDPRRFECESRYDPENRRVETHLVATRALVVEIPGVCDIRVGKGESIRTAVSCTFDRPRLTGMLGAVGLSIRWWEQAEDGRTAVAVAGPST
ncbi:MAG TPA: L-histidine N(alpha)-methyltransferase [Gemmatimonadaceae bacterium]|nr:L-histidine N(alpha)-methyltransferase [Gemmatimonadaceae bacterium]